MLRDQAGLIYGHHFIEDCPEPLSSLHSLSFPTIKNPCPKPVRDKFGILSETEDQQRISEEIEGLSLAVKQREQELTELEKSRDQALTYTEELQDRIETSEGTRGASWLLVTSN